MIGEIVVKLNCKKKKPKKKEKNMNTNFLQTLSNPIRGIFNRKKNKQNQEKKNTSKRSTVVIYPITI